MSNNTNCHNRSEAIVALVLGELKALAADELKQHLETCPACRQFHQILSDEEKTIRSVFQNLADTAAQKKTQLINQLDQLSNQPKPFIHSPSPPRRLWKGIKTMPKISKIAAVLVFAAALVGIFAVFTHNNGNMAFADVLNNIQKRSYTFNMTLTPVQMEEPVITEVKFHRSGKLRFDWTGPGSGEITTIADIKQKNSLIIFHKFKTAQYIDPSEEAKEAGDFLGFLTQPVDNLWNLRDGTEQRLENRQIDGQPAEGFRVLLKGQIAQQDITIWAHPQTGGPLLVEYVVTSVTDPEKNGEITLSDFNLNAELDESLFGPPPDYIVAEVKSLGDITSEKASPAPTPAGLQLENALTLWAQNQKDQAAEIFLAVDFSEPVRFSRDSYAFTLTEKDIVSMKAKERAKLMDEIMVVNGHFRAISRHVAALGQADVAQQEYEKAEQYFLKVYHFGKVITGEPEVIATVRMVGYAVTLSGLRELTALYSEIGAQEKLEWARQENQKVDAARIKYRDSIR